MNKKGIVATLLFGFLFLPHQASAGWQYEYFGDYVLAPIPSKTVVIDNVRPKVDEKINVKFKIRNGKNTVEGAKLKVYHLNHQKTVSQNLGCVNWDVKESHLLSTVDLPTYLPNQMYSGETSFFATEGNGFSRSNLMNNIVFVFEDGRNSLQLECKSTNYFVNLDDPKIDYADVILENIVAPQNIDLNVNSPIQINYTIKNIGKKQTMGFFQVCLERREEGTYPDSYPNRPAFCKQFRDVEEAIAAGGTYSGSFNLSPLTDSFSLNTSSKNYKLKPGRNRMVLHVNSEGTMFESNYSNNEFIFYIDAKGVVEPKKETITTNPVEEVKKEVPKTEPTKVSSPVSAPSTSPSTNQSIGEGDLLRSPLHASVYYYKNGKRHSFANRAVYATWYKDFSTLKTISVEQMEQIELGDPVSIKPRTLLLKFPLNPRVYEIVDEGILRHIQSEKEALTKYGADWNKKVIELPEIYFLFYRLQ